MRMVAPEELTFQTFEKLLNSRFRVRADTGLVEVDLVEVTRNCQQPNKVSDSFSLIFAGPLKAFLGQKTYRFEHDGFGSFDLFIVPTGKDANAFRYEAIFNRATRT